MAITKNCNIRRNSGSLRAAMGALGLQMPKIGPLDPAVVGPEQSRLGGGDTGPLVPHTSHIFDA